MASLGIGRSHPLSFELVLHFFMVSLSYNFLFLRELSHFLLEYIERTNTTMSNLHKNEDLIFRCCGCVSRWTSAMGVGDCGCSSCKSPNLDKDAGGHKVRDRIDWLVASRGQSEQDACGAVYGDEFQDVCGGECNPSQCSNGGGGGGESRCGCSSCTASVLRRDADGFHVGNRIDWVMKNLGRSEEDACDLVCGVEFSDVCGECDCDGAGGGGGGEPKCTGCSWDDGNTCPD